MNPTEEAMIRVLAERGMGWTPKGTDEHGMTSWASADRWYHYYGKTGEGWNPFTSISDAFMLQDAIEKMPIHIRQKFVTAIYNQIAGNQEIIGTLRIHWGMLNATPRQRSLAVFAALEGK